MSVEYTPPIHLEEIIAASEGADGMVSSMSVQLKDANGMIFGLHVATENNFVASSLEFNDEPTADFPEPVFVVPAMTIDKSLVEKIVEGSRPEILGMYLVPQD